MYKRRIPVNPIHFDFRLFSRKIDRNQSVFDSGAADNDSYTFDELGLISLDPTVGQAQYEDSSQNIPKGILLTHVIFHPIQKTLNRVIEVVYTLRIQMQ
mgnify:CR=1 FL=1